MNFVENIHYVTWEKFWILGDLAWNGPYVIRRWTDWGWTELQNIPCWGRTTEAQPVLHMSQSEMYGLL